MRTLALLSLLCGCHTPPWHLEYGEVPDRVRAIIDGVPGTEHRNIRVFYREEPGKPLALLRVTRAQEPLWIEMYRGTGDYFEAFLGHEYAHATIRPDWLPLPQVVEEGLADLLAAPLNPTAHERFSRNYRIGLAVLFEVGRRPPANWSEVDPAEHDTPEDVLTFALSLGTVLATEIPIEDLYEMCAAARAEGLAQIPDEWLLERVEPRNSDAVGVDRVEEILRRWLAEDPPQKIEWGAAVRTRDDGVQVYQRPLVLFPHVRRDS